MFILSRDKHGTRIAHVLSAYEVAGHKDPVGSIEPATPSYSDNEVECKTNTLLQSTISRVLNPPASETSTYTPTEWCTDFLRQTDWSTVYTTSSGVSTYTDWTITHLFVTKTDLDHPTSTMYCPIPSKGATCGLDSNIIAPIDQGEDWSIEHYYNPEECQQVCLEHPLCKAYRIDGSEEKGWGCEIFNVGLGVNGSNVISAKPGTQWWDRNCQQHIPTPCKAGTAPTGAGAVTSADGQASTPIVPRRLNPLHPRAPIITPAPILPRRAAPVEERAVLEKRDAPLPPYMEDLSYFWSSVYLTPACSCLITSALPPTLKTTIPTVTKWTSSTTVSSTYEDWFTVTTTPRETTTYVSIN
ncbi:hypothetical protein EJ04DRAFT_563824 [Polyplosphaeria fusca]|uniref:Apple domain-containing protein n=1 Tax=Polyplosphaeria fusca TaxID=682080 RepID=A0A9P4QW38_9PLEO|nr:hypothetical protein EJ04DRAFT_563824 [Polyplosphaeria fusca]